MSTNVALWVGFNLSVLVMLGVDLGLVRRQSKVVSPREAGIWTAVWVTLSLLFCGGLWLWYWRQTGPALEWLAAYVIEYSLSVDNLFVFLLVFSYFRVAPENQHRVLFWGILGAFVMRAVLILLGTALVSRFQWLLYLFGGFLVFTGLRMLFSNKEEEAQEDPEKRLIVRLARRVLPVSKTADSQHFMVREGGRWMVTPLFLVLLVVEATDLLFAVDSIPAVLGISQDPFIVYTSNVCAILGLRSLFFVVASLMDKFHFLNVGLAIILSFVGVKMLVTFFDIHVHIGLSLGIIGMVLAGSIIASLVWPKPASEGREGA